jgi:uncharacterized protein (DUF58 family)
MRRSKPAHAPGFFSPRRLYNSYRHSLTAAGKTLLWITVASALLGVNTNHNRVYVVFAVSFGLLAGAIFASLLARPRVKVTGRISRRTMAGETLVWCVEVTALRAADDIWLELRDLPDGVRPEPGIEPGVGFLAAGETHVFEIRLTFLRRGAYDLPGVRVESTHPFGLVRNGSFHPVAARVLVHPRFDQLDGYSLILGRRLHPGGLVLAHSVGESTEFIGTREYRAGDPLRKLHPMSWARTGSPVVRIDQEEFYARVALVVDTADPRRGRRLERSASAAASLVDWVVRAHYLVELVAAGPDLYTITAGRGLAHLEQVLDILACLEPTEVASFQTIAPEFFDRISRISTVILLLLDWDAPRAAFVERVRATGAALEPYVLGAPGMPPPGDVRIIPDAGPVISGLIRDLPVREGLS